MKKISSVNLEPSRENKKILEAKGYVLLVCWTRA